MLFIVLNHRYITLFTSRDHSLCVHHINHKNGYISLYIEPYIRHLYIRRYVHRYYIYSNIYLMYIYRY